MKKLELFLNEAYLTSEYTFGFELEAISTKKFKNNVELAKFMDSKFGFKDSKVVEDQSIVPSKDKGGVGFEYVSPVLQLNPGNIQKVLKLLSSLDNIGVYTNPSCGFHIHMAFPYIKDVDLVWILSNLAIDNSMKNKLMYFKKIKFYNPTFADKTFLNLIRDAIVKKEYNKLKYLFSDEKYRAFRIHPQGTLEWRGPRNFMKDPQLIKDFLMLIVEFIKWMDKTLDNNKIGSISKKEFLELIQVEPGSIVKKDNLKFSLKQDRKLIPIIISQFPWIKSCNFFDGKFEIKNNILFSYNTLWHDGTWEDGVFSGGIWENGTWENGYFQHAVWEDGAWEKGEMELSTWEDGTWETGEFITGIWDDGEWRNGIFEDSIWKNGVWENGSFRDSIWENGEWYDGEWKDGYFHAGTWEGGVWEDGFWLGGNWRGGVWKEGIIVFENNMIYSIGISPKEFAKITKGMKVEDVETVSKYNENLNYIGKVKRGVGNKIVDFQYIATSKVKDKYKKETDIINAIKI